MLLIVSRIIIPRGFRGLTIFPFVIVGDKKDSADPVLLNHERIHLRQQAELLIIPFFIWYLADYAVKLAKYRDSGVAYRNIIFEREAYSNEQNMAYCSNRRLWSFLK